MTDERTLISELETLRAFRLDARDALTKPIDTTEISQAIERVLRHERPAGEREMSTMQHKTNLILQHISEGVYTVDKDLRITSVNPAMERITGWKESELLGHRYDQVFAPQLDNHRLPPEQTLPGQALYNHSPIVSSQNTILHKHGHRIPIAGTAVLLNDSDASNTGVLATMRDLTPETKLRHMHSEIIAVIDQWLHTPPAHSELESMYCHCHPVTLKPIITQVIQRFQNTTTNCSFQLELAPNLPFAIGDEKRIKLALVNLIENVLVLDDPQQPVVISANASDKCIVVAVEGVPVSVKGQPTPEIKLHIAKKLIQTQGGQVWTSQPNTKTRFHFSLPKLEIDNDAHAFID